MIDGEREHPGYFLRDWVFQPGTTIGVLAERIGISRQSLSYILNGKSGISPEVAANIEREFGTRQETLLRMDRAYKAQKKRWKKEVDQN